MVGRSVEGAERARESQVLQGHDCRTRAERGCEEMWDQNAQRQVGPWSSGLESWWWWWGWCQATMGSHTQTPRSWRSHRDPSLDSRTFSWSVLVWGPLICGLNCSTHGHGPPFQPEPGVPHALASLSLVQTVTMGEISQAHAGRDLSGMTLGQPLMGPGCGGCPRLLSRGQARSHHSRFDY